MLRFWFPSLFCVEIPSNCHPSEFRDGLRLREFLDSELNQECEE